MAVAATFSSRVVSTANEALLASTSCGFPSLKVLDVDNMTTAGLAQAHATYVTGTYLAETAHALSKACFQTTGFVNTFACPSFIPRQSLEREAGCLFTNGSCLSGTIVLDSGLLDSNDDFGINARAEDRIQFRKKLACAVVAAEERYSSDWIVPEEVSGMEFFPFDPRLNQEGVRYKIFNLGNTYSGAFERNFTFVVANFSSRPRAYSTL
jgi:hypothetical protein